MHLDRIEILTNRLKQTKDFYEHVLNLPIVESGAKSVEIPIGTSTLVFLENTDTPSPVYHLAFTIPENQLHEAIAWGAHRLGLIQLDGTLFIAHFEAWNAHSVYFYDNNGNILEFIARHDLHNATTVAFDSGQIVNISEIGIVADHPMELAQQLIEAYDLDFFEKNKNSETFAALGDDHGLLVIAKNNRNWYPTNVPAKAHWTRICLTDKGAPKTIELKA